VPSRSAYIRALAARAALGVVVALVVVLALSAATDEGGLSMLVRVGRVLPLVPACAALSSFVVLRGARERGEVRALAALGLAPKALALVAAMSACAVPLAVGTGLGQGLLDVAGFFPAPPEAPALEVVGDAFVSTDLGVSIAPDGTLTPSTRGGAATGTSTGARLPPHGGASAGIATGLASLAFALAAALAGSGAAADLRPWRHYVVVVVGAAALVLSYQLVAAGRAFVFLPVVPATLLLLLEASRYRRTA
jgi:hypothetical protein